MEPESVHAELAQVRRELEYMKTADPFRVVEMAIEIATERIKVVDAMAARDAAVQRLSDAYISLRQKITIIERLQHDPYNNEPSPEQVAAQAEIDRLKSEITVLEATVCALKEDIRVLKEKETLRPPKYEEPLLKNLHNFDVQVPALLSLRLPRETPPVPSRCPSTTSVSSVTTENHSIRPALKRENSDMEFAITRSVSQYTQSALDAEDIIDQRNKFLATIPVPLEAPDDTLKPIVLPSSLTLHEFLGNVCTPSLSNYRILQQLTTSWCPEREEHGYALAPVFKCNTNPRVATAHRWTAVDIMARINKPTECFYNRDGAWYYAGVYKAFRMDDLLSKNGKLYQTKYATVQCLIKETLSGRKNISPQNIYETSQLYAAGALKIACLGLQCVGFNKTLYTTILDQADKCHAGPAKWGGKGSGLGSRGRRGTRVRLAVTTKESGENAMSL
ncbi:hypothetical protein BDZ89DRAFT_1073925 [Hymenopellis radicata]|nr:hypothetical protein BDZ89DRAFT_1073925 [Hymenopellis radicata]